MTLFVRERRLSFHQSSVQRRHRSDTEVNHRETKIVDGRELVPTQWKEIQVGQIVRLENNESVPVRPCCRGERTGKGAASTFLGRSRPRFNQRTARSLLY